MIEYPVYTCAISCAFLLLYFGYLWITGRRDEAIDCLGGIGISILALSISLLVMNKETVAHFLGVTLDALDPSRAIDRVQHLVNVISDRIKFVSGLMLGLAYAELIAMLVGTGAGGPAGIVAGGLSSSVVMGQIGSSLGVGVLKGLMYCYSWMMILCALTLILLRACTTLGYQMVSFGACLLPIPKVRGLGIALVAWGLVLTYALPLAVNTAEIPTALGEVKLSEVPPGDYGVLYVESTSKHGALPYTMLILRTGSGRLFTLQANRYGRKIALIPLGSYNISGACVYWLVFLCEGCGVVNVTTPLNGAIRDHYTDRTTVSDGILCYEGNYSQLQLQLPGDFIANLSGVYGWSSVVGGEGRASLLSVDTDGSLSYTLYFFVNSSRTIFFVGNRPSVKVLGYYVDGSWRDSPINFTLSYRIIESGIGDLKKHYNISWVESSLLERLYSNYVEWYERQLWLKGEYIDKVREYYPNMPDPRVYFRPPISKEEFREFSEYRPPVYKVEVACKQTANTTADPDWFASVEISMPPSSRAWTYQQWMFYNPYTGLCEELLRRENIGLLEEFKIVPPLAESILVKFILYLFVADALSGIFGGVSGFGWICGLLWNRVLRTYATSITAFIIGLGRAVSRSRVYELVARRFGFRITAGLKVQEVMARKSMFSWKPWRSSLKWWSGLRVGERIKVMESALETELRGLRGERLRRAFSKGIAITGMTLGYTASVMRERMVPGLIRLSRDAVGIRESESIRPSRVYRALDKAHRISRATVWDVDRGMVRHVRRLVVRRIVEKRIERMNIAELVEVLRGLKSPLRELIYRELGKEVMRYVESLEPKLHKALEEELLRIRPELASELRKLPERDLYSLHKLTPKDTTLSAVMVYAGVKLDLLKSGRIRSVEELVKTARDIAYLKAIYECSTRLLEQMMLEDVKTAEGVAEFIEQRIAPFKRGSIGALTVADLGSVGDILRSEVSRIVNRKPEDVLRDLKIDLERPEDLKEISRGIEVYCDLEELRNTLHPSSIVMRRLTVLREIRDYVDKIQYFVNNGLLDERIAMVACTHVLRPLLRGDLRMREGEAQVYRMINSTILEEVRRGIARITDVGVLRDLGVEVLEVERPRIRDVDRFLEDIGEVRRVVSEVAEVREDVFRGMSMCLKVLEKDLGEVESEPSEIALSLSAELSIIARRLGESVGEETIAPLVRSLRELAGKLRDDVSMEVYIPSFIFTPIEEVKVELPIPGALVWGLVEYDKRAVVEAVKAGDRDVLEYMNRRGWLLVYMASKTLNIDPELILTRLELGSRIDLEEIWRRVEGLEDERLKYIWTVVLSSRDVKRGMIPTEISEYLRRWV